MTAGPAAAGATATDTIDVDLSNPARLGELRSLPRPTRRDEAWRYAPHRRLSELVFGPPASAPPRLPASVTERMPSLGGPRIVVVNGAVDHALSDLGDRDGVVLSTLADPAGSSAGAVDAHVGRSAHDVADAFEALNVVFGEDGAVVDVPSGCRVDAPIHVVDVVLPGGEPEGGGQDVWCSGVVVHLGAGASATLVETRLGEGEGLGGSSIRTTVTLEEDAVLDHLVLQDLAPAQVHLGRTEVAQAERSTYRSTAFNLGAGYGRLDYAVRLGGAEATAELAGLFVGAGEQTLDQQVSVVHESPDCTSRQFFRGVLDDASTGVFNGGIDVRPGAIGTDAEQSNDNLLLSRRAEVDTQPRLEILADDVACKHGATVGQLDDLALYYLRSRGVPAEQARRLLVSGFAGAVVDRIGVAAVRSWIAERVGLADERVDLADG